MLMSETMGRAWAPHSEKRSPRSDLRKRALPLTSLVRATEASPMNSSTPVKYRTDPMALDPTAARNVSGVFRSSGSSSSLNSLAKLSRRITPCGRPLMSTSRSLAAHLFCRLTRKVRRPLSQSVSPE
ncbi:MAG: hypothetical protein BWX71_01199 [Deltaproteobacteria bacterium ADurb.Bin072]|nr:MAG: hypothetical protein BWX71_01199 [Deltaproteobacteria bacterium ADurb.Bin072]